MLEVRFACVEHLFVLKTGKRVKKILSISVFSPYGQGCFFCSGMTGLFLKKLSKLGP